MAFIGCSYASKLIVKVVFVDPPVEVEEIVVYRSKPAKKIIRKIASVEDQILLPRNEIQEREVSSDSSKSNKPYPDEASQPESPNANTSGSNYYPASESFSSFAPNYYRNSVLENNKSGPSQSVLASKASLGGGGGGFVSVSNSSLGVKAATPVPSESSPVVTVPRAPSSTSSSFTHLFALNSTESSNYLFDASKILMDSTEASLATTTELATDQSSTDFSGVMVGLEYKSLSDGSEGIGAGSLGGCDFLTTNCAELSMSWAPQPSELMGIWHLNEVTNGQAPGGLDFTDSSGNGRHGSRVGSPGFNILGRLQSGVENTYALHGGGVLPVNLSSTNKVSISFWINNKSNPAGMNETNLIFEYTPNFNSTSGFYLASNDCSNSNIVCENMVFAGHSVVPAGYFLVEGAPMSQGWQHIVVSYDRSVIPNTMRVYKNGKLASFSQVTAYTTSSSENFSSSSLYFFGRAGNNHSAKGTLDEIAVWSSILTETDVKTIYERQSASFGRAGHLGFYNSPIIDLGESLSMAGMSWHTPFPYGKHPLITDSPSSYSQAQGSLTNQLIGYWRLDEATGAVTAVDSQSSHLDGSIGSTVVMGDEGKLNTGAKFVRSANSYINLGARPELNIGLQDWSVAAWVQTRFSGEQIVMAKSRYGAQLGRWSLGIGLVTPGRLGFMIDIGGGGIVTESTIPVNDGKWHHVAATLDRDGLLKIFIDGTLNNTLDISSSSAQNWTTNHIAVIGNYGAVNGLSVITSPVLSLDGLIDEVGVWNKVLGDGSNGSENEIRDLYVRSASRIKHQVRICDDQNCLNDDWKGPNGQDDTYFSELLNLSATHAALSFSSPFSTRYFQYRTIFESESVSSSHYPELNQVSINSGELFYRGGVEFVTSGISFVDVYTFAEVLGTQGCTGNVRYAVSTASVGPWYYWDGVDWSLSANSTESSLMSDMNSATAIQKFNTQFASGNLYLKGYLFSDGASACSLKSVSVTGTK